MTERKIQDWLWLHLKLKGHENICPNYTPAKWWECDMFSTTKSGFMVEHEIKLTVSDFKNDAKKRKKERGYGETNFRSKYQELECRNSEGPSRFFYVVPTGLIDRKDLPPWAGMIYAEDLLKCERPLNRISFHEVVNAPRLHSNPAGTDVIKHLDTVFYWRFWNERRKACK